MKFAGVILIGAALAAVFLNRKNIGSLIMKLSDNGLSLLERREGVRLKPYLDAAGKPTIGYGHLILPGENFSAGISEAQARELLRVDTEKAQKAVRDAVSHPLNQNQFDALVSLAFNIGANAFRGSTLVKLLNQGYVAAAAEQILAWKYAGGKPVLLARRQAEKAQFETPAAP